MKKLNKKGFTLIELLVVIVILIVIMAIAIPSVTSSIERSKDKQKQQVIKIVETAAELYCDSHRNSCTSNSITIKTLIDNKYLTAVEAKDPFYEKRTICGFVQKNNNGTYNFQERTTCDSSCSTGTNCVKID